MHASEQDRPDVKAARDELRALQQELDACQLVFLDETAVKTNMAPTHGRCPRGERLIDKAPHGHWKTTTLLCAIRTTGLRALELFDGAVNGDRFLEWVKTCLAPILKRGDIVLMDNLRSHKVDGVIAAIEAKGASVRYLPPYSPDFNPIEKSFNQIKGWLKKQKIRIKEMLWEQLKSAHKLISPTHARNYFKSCGYCRFGRKALAA